MLHANFKLCNTKSKTTISDFFHFMLTDMPQLSMIRFKAKTLDAYLMHKMHKILIRTVDY